MIEQRRLTNRVWLKDYTVDQLIGIYLTALASALSDPPPALQLTKVATQTYFTTHALDFLSDIVEGARVQSDMGAVSPLLDHVFAAQAGAMTTLANVTAMLIASSISYKYVKQFPMRNRMQIEFKIIIHTPPLTLSLTPAARTYLGPTASCIPTVAQNTVTVKLGCTDSWYNSWYSCTHRWVHIADIAMRW